MSRRESEGAKPMGGILADDQVRTEMGQEGLPGRMLLLELLLLVGLAAVCRWLGVCRAVWSSCMFLLLGGWHEHAAFQRGLVVNAWIEGCMSNLCA